jgi:hypothetical protein
MMSEDRDAVANRRQRVAQLVGEHREELVLASIHFFEGHPNFHML